MRSRCFHARTSSYFISSDSNSSPKMRTSDSATSPRDHFSDSMILLEKSVKAAEPMILKWNPESSAFAKVTSMLYENRTEAMNFIECVEKLQKAMYQLVSEDQPSAMLVQAQSLMQIAMTRLQKEFYQILYLNRAHLDPKSVTAQSSRCSARSSSSDDDYDGTVDNDVSEGEEDSYIAMADLRSIAECMISCGYGKECISIYKIIRKSIVDEGIHHLGVEKQSSSQINKMDWELLEVKIKNWLDAVKIAVRTLFTRERILCDHVFTASDSIRETCFTEISKEGALLLFHFPELVAAKARKSPERMFRLLDMYTTMAENSMEIEAIFSFNSISSVPFQAYNTLFRLGDSIRTMVSDFESLIHKDSSKSPVAGAGVHNLTLQTMNYLSLLADYSNVLADIFADWTLPNKSSQPESYFECISSDESPAPAFSLRVAWLILILLCKLDGKAKQYKVVSLSYLFLSNNLRHVTCKVRTSSLQYILGEEWIIKEEAKVKQFAANYERLAWGSVISSLPENPTAEISRAEAAEVFQNFNTTFDQAFRTQKMCVVADSKFRDEIQISIALKLVPAYREFYNVHRNVGQCVRFSPEDVCNYLSDLFITGLERMSTSSSSSGSP